MIIPHIEVRQRIPTSVFFWLHINFTSPGFWSSGPGFPAGTDTRPSSQHPEPGPDVRSPDTSERTAGTKPGAPAGRSPTPHFTNTQILNINIDFS